MSRDRGTSGALSSVLLVLCCAVLVAGCGRAPARPKAKTKKSESPTKYVEAGQKLNHVNATSQERKKAIVAFSQAIKIDPKCQKAYAGRAVAYNEDGQPQKALSDFSKAIQLDPTLPYLYEQRASLYEQRGDRTKAQADRQRASDLRFKNWEALPEKASQHRKRGKR